MVFIKAKVLIVKALKCTVMAFDSQQQTCLWHIVWHRSRYQISIAALFKVQEKNLINEPESFLDFTLINMLSMLRFTKVASVARKLP